MSKSRRQTKSRRATVPAAGGVAKGAVPQSRGSFRAGKARGLNALPPTAQLGALAEWLEYAERLYGIQNLSLGQITDSAHDEALYLFLHVLGWPLDGDVSLLKKRLSPQQRIALRSVLERRIVQKIPAAYITGEALLNEHRFYVDERVLIPRSYFLEVIPHMLDRWFPQPTRVKRTADVCTGSGCLAILLAHHFPNARVDAIDLSKDALEVAAINVDRHHLEGRIRLFKSDVLAEVEKPKGGYDLIISNPPYEPSALCDQLPEEFLREPRLALDGGADGLSIIRKLIAQSSDRLSPEGVLLIEVGGLKEAMDDEFAHLNLEWLESQDGANCICAVEARCLR